jgi:polyhydroxyalkanoate synthase subunit PhaC
MSIREPASASASAAFRERLDASLEQAVASQPVDLRLLPWETVYQEGSSTLRYYGAADSDRTPVLILYSLINRPYLLELGPEASLIEHLRDTGSPVYLLDWGEPEPVDRFLTLDDYINGCLRRSADVVRRRHGAAALDIVGICQGGTFALCFAALHPQRVRRLVTLVTPVDFHAGESTLYRLSRHIDIDAVVAARGSVSAEALNAVFVGLKPYRLLSQRYVDMVRLAGDPDALREFLRLERWMYDSPDQSGEAYRQFVKDCYQLNRLVKGTLQLGERTVSLQELRLPILNVYAADDHLIPAASARALGACAPQAAYKEIEVAGGHLAMFLNGSIQRSLYPRITRWLSNTCVSPDVRP